MCGGHIMCEHLPSGRLTGNIAFGNGRFCVSVSRTRKGQGPLLNMGQSPIPHYYYDGMVREESAYGGYAMYEHLLSGWLTPSTACRTGRFAVLPVGCSVVCGAASLHCSANRVRYILRRRYAATASPTAPSIKCNTASGKHNL